MSGAGPYTITSILSSYWGINAGYYRLEVWWTANLTECSLVCGSGTIQNAITTAMNNGLPFVYTGEVPSGRCRSLSLKLIRNSDNLVVDCVMARIDNT